MLVLLLLLLLFRLGLRLVCIILALILLPLHHVVDSGRIRAETNSVHCPRSGQVKQWPTPQSRCSTLRRPHQGVEEGGQGGRISNPRTTDQTSQADRTGWTAACRVCKSPMVGGWRLDWSPGRSVNGRMMADRNRRRSNYLESRPSKWGAEAKKMGVGLTCRKQ